MNPWNTELYCLLICMGAFVYWLGFEWHWQHCTVLKYYFDLSCGLLTHLRKHNTATVCDSAHYTFKQSFCLPKQTYCDNYYTADTHPTANTELWLQLPTAYIVVHGGIHYSFSLPLQTQNSSFPQIFSSIVLPLHPPDWLHGLQVFFVFLGHVGFNFGIVC